MDAPKQKVPEVVKVLLVSAFTAAAVVGFGEYLFWTKPLQDELAKLHKENNSLTEQIHVLTQTAEGQQAYSNEALGFSFQYPESYEIKEAQQNASVPPEAMLYLQKKNDTTNTAVLWIAIREKEKALTPATSFADKVVKSETTVGKDTISAVAISLLPGRGDEFASSLHVVNIVVPLISDPAKALVITNVGDADLETFQQVLATFRLK